MIRHHGRTWATERAQRKHKPWGAPPATELYGKDEIASVSCNHLAVERASCNVEIKPRGRTGFRHAPVPACFHLTRRVCLPVADKSGASARGPRPNQSEHERLHGHDVALHARQSSSVAEGRAPSPRVGRRTEAGRRSFPCPAKRACVRLSCSRAPTRTWLEGERA